MIRFEKVYKEYKNGVLALQDINLAINPKDFVFLVGSSGAGKSSMLKLLIREESVNKGNIYVEDIDITTLPKRQIPQLRRKIGFVFQDYRLLPKKTVFENVAYAMEIAGASKKEIKKEVPRALELVNLLNKASSYPDQLSGGESQRVSIARAIVNDPPILACDEPTGNLDFETARDIMNALDNINKNGTTIIMATHARNIVDMMQKRVVTLNSGRIISDVVEGGYYENTTSI